MVREGDEGVCIVRVLLLVESERDHGYVSLFGYVFERHYTIWVSLGITVDK